MEQPFRREKHQQKDTYMDMVPWVSKYLNFRYVIETEGVETIPSDPTMFVSNHLRFDDSLLLATVYAEQTGQPLRLGGKQEYFDGKGIDNKGRFGKTIQRFVENTHQIPVPREENARGLVQLEKDVRERFSLGESVLLHAEGTRSPDGRINKFQIGAGRFAVKANVGLMPASTTYEKRRMNLLAGRFDPRTVAQVKFGELLLPPTYGMELHRFPLIPNSLIDAIEPRIMNQSKRIEEITDILEERVANLSGQERSGYRLDPYTKQLIIPE